MILSPAIIGGGDGCHRRPRPTLREDLFDAAWKPEEFLTEQEFEFQSTKIVLVLSTSTDIHVNSAMNLNQDSSQESFPVLIVNWRTRSS